MNEHKKILRQVQGRSVNERIHDGYYDLLSMAEEFPLNALFASVKGTEGDNEHQRIVNFHVFSPEHQFGPNMTLFNVFTRSVESGLSSGEKLANRIEYQVRSRLGRVAVFVPGRSRLNGKLEWVLHPIRNEERAQNVAGILNTFKPDKCSE